MTRLKNLEQFRNYPYRILGNGRDALFDLMDAVLTSRSVSSFVELTLSPVFRQEWSSIYEGLQAGRPPRQALMQHSVAQIPGAALTILAGDHTAWSRPHAVTLQERTYEHQPQLGVGSKPVTVGQGYSTIVWVPAAEGSWALPLLHERITSFETALAKAPPTLSEVWQKYLRRFAIEHWYRFLRQRLHWTRPQLSTPAQMETWSDLMPLLTWQLWLAREVVEDAPLPWQKTMTKLSPGRIADSFALLLLRIASPAPDPNPRGKSPGWMIGRERKRRTRYPTVKKSYRRPIEDSKKAA